MQRSGQATLAAGGLLDQLVGDLGIDELQGFDFTASEELQNQGVEPGDIERVDLTSLRIRSTAGDDLSFLDEVEVFVEAPQLEPVLAAHGSSFAGQTEVELDVEGVNLASYAVAPSMTVRVEGSGRRPEQETTVVVDATFDVGVTAQGACNALR